MQDGVGLAELAGQAEPEVHRLQQRLHGEPSNAGGNLEQQRDTFVGPGLVLNADAEPDVGRYGPINPIHPPRQPLEVTAAKQPRLRKPAEEILRTFREQQPVEVGREVD